MNSELLSISQDLIRFKTVDGNEAEFKRAVKYVRNYFASMPSLYIHESWFNNAPSLVIGNQPGTKEFDILISTHLDVVDAKDKDFTPTIRGGKLYGRGAADMKTMVAAGMLLMKHIGDHPIDHSLGLMITFDEETGGFNGTAKLVEAGYLGKVVIVPDDMGAFQITTKEKGIIGLDVHFTGVPSHSCEPWNGSSAADNFLLFASKIRQQYPVLDQEAWVTTCNIGPIKSDHPRNQLSPALNVSLDIRYTEEINAQMVIRDITDLARHHQATVTEVLNEPMVLTASDAPAVQSFKQAAEQILGQEVTTAVDHGASDARHFTQTDCQIIMFKPPTQGMHSDNEAVTIADLETFYQILKNYCTLEEYHERHIIKTNRATNDRQ